MSVIISRIWHVLSLALLSLVICSFAHGQTKSMTVKDPRPVAKALEQLESLYGWPITYEDPPYVHSSDVVDVTESVRRDNLRDKAHRVLVPRGGNLSSTYGAPSTNAPSQQDLPTVLRAIREVLNSYDASHSADMFTVVQADTLFHIVPIKLMNASGQVEKVTPLLDTTISILPKQRTGDDLIDEICRSLSLATSHHVIIGMIPLKLFRDHTTTITASGETVRSVLDRLLKEMNVPLSWQLFYDPGLRWYALNIHNVAPANK